MVDLLIMEGPEQGKRFKLETGVHYLGKDATKCDILINDPTVSRVHAKVTIEDGKVRIEDLGSKNGVFLRNGQLDRETEITPGDVITVGQSVLKFEFGRDFTPANSYTRILALKPGTINIGRDPSNNVVITHPLVSRFHARIVSSGNQPLLYDLGSSNGTYVNGQSVRKPVEVLPNSLIQIGGYTYLFDGQNLTEYDENQLKLEVRALQKSVRVASGGSKVLLDNINLTINPQEFVAILGGSGAGKSTLMGSLTGMAPASSGEVLVNGRNLYKNYDSFRSLIGYVPQDDIVHLELTVREVLTYSAKLRLPDDASPEDIKLRVDEVLKDLELSRQEEVLVKNLSGGQRKRVSIGVELLTKPSLFFLDEPTSGLDPGLEKIMMELFRKLANQGRTIMLVTHATFNIELCDKVIFLTAGGKLAFYGSPKECSEYFQAKDFAEIYKTLETNKDPERWAEGFRKSPYYQKYCKQESNRASGGDVSLPTKRSKAGNKSPFKQFAVLLQRYSHILYRDQKNLFILFFQPIIIALLIFMVFSHNDGLFDKSKYEPSDLEITQEVVASDRLDEVMDNNEEENSRRKNMTTSIILMVITAIWLGTSNASKEIVKELPIYRRERLVNIRILPYLLSKVLVLAAICLVQITCLVLLVSLGLGLPGLGANLMAFFVISLASILMGLSVSALVSNTDKAVSTVPILLIPQILLSGAFVPQENVEPEFLQPIFNLAISKWGYELVGGGVIDINAKVALSKPLKALSGNFGNHWWALVVFIAAFFLVSIYAIKRKDQCI